MRRDHGRRLLIAFADAAPALSPTSVPSEGGFWRRLLIAFADAAPAFSPTLGDPAARAVNAAHGSEHSGQPAAVGTRNEAPVGRVPYLTTPGPADERGTELRSVFLSGLPTDHLVICIMVADFSRKSVPQQIVIQRELGRVLEEASRRAGLDRDRAHLQVTGDGETVVVPYVDLKVGSFVTELENALVRYNRALRDPIRLRVAMAVGLVAYGGTGFAGSAVVEANRLADSEPVRAALRAVPQSDLAVIFSETAFREFVEAERDVLPSGYFRIAEVVVPAKGFHTTAYLYTPRLRGTYLQIEVPDGNGEELAHLAEWLRHEPVLADRVQSTPRRDLASRFGGVPAAVTVALSLDDEGISTQTFQAMTRSLAAWLQRTNVAINLTAKGRTVRTGSLDPSDLMWLLLQVLSARESDRDA